jgi:tRNA-dihydrouridine synthase A
VPVTVKCRLGVDEQEDYEVFLAFVDTVAATGCRRFIVHARKAWLQGLSPKENREIPPLRYEWVHRLKRERPDLVVSLNGGLRETDDLRAQLARVDGVMIGRAAYHEPYRLHEYAVAFDGEPRRPRAALLRAWFPYVERQLAAGVAMKHLSRHVLGLFHARPGGRAFRQILSEGAAKPGAGIALLERALAATEASPEAA